ncbi:hypothetical protein Ptr902_05622 [Pyrenophora tritici-repentis]|nr:hypothetical protein Ptr902_05622 [Pyrenophora tritici-repentis]
MNKDFEKDLVKSISKNYIVAGFKISAKDGLKAYLEKEET